VGWVQWGLVYRLPFGASFHEKDREIWVIVGDGSIQMTIMELGTAIQENVNINIAIIIMVTLEWYGNAGSKCL
jgi:TPP-dependent 2-oxoacid decarboxylase